MDINYYKAWQALMNYLTEQESKHRPNSDEAEMIYTIKAKAEMILEENTTFYAYWKKNTYEHMKTIKNTYPLLHREIIQKWRYEGYRTVHHNLSRSAYNEYQKYIEEQEEEQSVVN